jgi:branched-chain amino acid transport system permease protein
MSEMTPPAGDRQLEVFNRFDGDLRAQINSLITDELIEEHRHKPLGQHSDALERVLNYFRRPPHFGLYSRVACHEYQVIALPVPPGGVPEPIDEPVYYDKTEALHAVFLRHVDMLRQHAGGE